MNTNELVLRIESALPQTQCTQCGFNGCRPYAEAIAANEAPINRCPPGGMQGIEKLAAITQTPVVPFDTSCGDPNLPLQVAFILAEHCIGCTLCIQACPVDAIVGANKRMHTVLADWCTGCALCLPPCPVDCIELHPAGRVWSEADATQAKTHYDQRALRLERHQKEEDHAFAEESTIKRNGQVLATIDTTEQKSDRIHAALAAARARRQKPV